MLYTLPSHQSGQSQNEPQTDNMYNTNLLELNYTVVDLETTGTHPKINQIIEIGIVKIEKGQIIDTYQTLLNPKTHIPLFITQMTGIKNEDVKYAPVFSEIVRKIIPYFENSIFVAHNAAFDYAFLQKNFNECTVTLHTPKICTVQLARKLIPQLRHHRLDDLIRYFNIQINKRHRALDDAIATGKSLLQMINILIKNGRKIFGELMEITQPMQKIKYNILKPTIDAIPKTPGIYIMKNKDNQIIYIGKSKCLQKRVKSYFYNNNQVSKKQEKIIQSVESIEYEKTGSELAALLLESKKIKEHLPCFNTRIRNYKTYPYLKISNEDFPRLYTTNEIKSDNGEYYGPFKSASIVKNYIDQLQKIFNIRPCKHKINLKKPESLKTCIYYELGKCPGVCGGKITKEEYAKNIAKLKSFLNGNKQNIEKKLQEKIKKLSEKMEYEHAAEIRNQLLAISHISQHQQIMAQSIKNNNVIIIQNSTEKKYREIFFIKNSIVKARLTVKSRSHDQKSTQINLKKNNKKTENKKTKKIWQEKLNAIYTNQTNEQITKENIDEIMIITTWLMRNQQVQNTYFVNNNTKKLSTLLNEKFVLDIQ